MGYRTVQHVPRTRAYGLAKAKYDTTKPIRGTDNKRPLGQRRDWESYWVRMDGDDVQFMLYKTPVVTFHPDNTITIFTDGWTSVSTRQFIIQVLGVHCFAHRGRMVIEVGGHKFFMENKTTLRLKVDNYTMTPIDEPTPNVGLRVNRKAANNVRARVKPFADYLQGFINLRKTDIQNQWGTMFEAVGVTAGEVADAIGEIEANKRFPNQMFTDTSRFNKINCRPYEDWRMRSYGTDKYVTLREYYANAAEFIGWVTSGDHEQFYKAALVLTMMGRAMPVMTQEQRATPVYKESNLIPHTLTNIVMRWFARDILEEFELPEGKLPNPTYMQWFGELDTFKGE